MTEQYSAGLVAVPQKQLDVPDTEHLRLALCSSRDARAMLPYDTALDLCVLPLGLLSTSAGERVLTAYVPAPLDPTLLQQVQFVTGLEVHPEVAERAAIERAIQRSYRGDDQALHRAVARTRGTEPPQHCTEAVLDVHDKPVPALVSAILERGVALEASDIHIEPFASSYVIRYRVNGLLERADGVSLTPTAAHQIARHLKVLAKLDTTTDYLPLEGSFTFSSAGKVLRVRLACIPAVCGEKIALRLLDSNSIAISDDSVTATLSELGLREDERKLLLAMLARKNGSLLLAGPTGSGKSTLLTAALTHLNREWRNIVTIEDPVERQIAGVVHTEINSARGLDYPELLTALLRHDPDVIMIGEIRDEQTAKVGLTAGLTGHLVLSTVHAGDALEVMPRLIQLGAEPVLIGNSLRLVVSQRLVPRNCPECTETQVGAKELLHAFGLEPGTVLTHSCGCETCRGTGLNGRLGVFEFLVLGDSMRQMLMSYASGENPDFYRRLRDEAFRGGYQPLACRLREVLLSGVISPQAMLHTLGLSPESFGYGQAPFFGQRSQRV